jgi:nucleoside-diphosphate-sugar epimerase
MDQTLCHLTQRLLDQGNNVIGADIKSHEYSKISFTNFFECDLREIENVRKDIPDNADEVYQLTAAGKEVKINHIPGPQGVRGRNSDNKLIREVLNWEPKYSLVYGLKITYKWICGKLSVV